MMRLRYTPMKGYVHTIEAVVNYAGLRDRVEPVKTDPFDEIDSLIADNPLSTVPTLILEGGQAVYGGPVIYEVLDTLHARPRLFPPERWLPVRRLLWLADGVFDQYIRATREVKEPDNMRRPHLVARQWRKLLAALDALEAQAPSFGPLDIGQVRAVGTLAFLDRTYTLVVDLMKMDALPPAFDWRNGRPALTAWYNRTAPDPIFTQPLLPET
ncbi:MAG: glutathione S-transferase N-terminal domain-containing protein [Rhodospirillaceae bacterium]|nr:glutathione S-transferase N-terminal domain-containing protein [Rhodospirillaceae bacterium]